MKLVVIDYGLSNLLSVCRSFAFLGCEPVVSSSPEEVLAADALVLPGVGAFADGMAGLQKLGLDDAVKKAVAAGTPLLGICLGMQMLFDEGEEFGCHKGLGLIPGRVVKLADRDTDGAPLRIPHVGWNGLYPVGSEQFTDILAPLTPGDETYFVHSFAAETDASFHLADTFYGGHAVTAAVRCKNVFGTQFHPEKSGRIGLAILGEYLRLCENS